MRFEKSATRGTGPGRREYKTVQFELEKYDEEQGIVSGYASVFGNVDDGGDVVEPGAFAETIAEGVGRVKILALHNDCWLPVGRPLVLKEDTKGLYFEARISDTALGRDVKTLIRDGVLTEFSIGYDPIEFEFDATGIRHLRKVKLWEISIVTWAMNPEATVTDYKQQKQTTEEVHMRLENNATGPSAGKSMSMGTDELKEIVKSAVKEAKEGAASDDDSPSDSDELKELIKAAVKEGLADDGSGDPPPDGASEDESKTDDDTNGECKEDESTGDESKEGDPAEDESAKRRKSAAPARQTKAASQSAPAQRKYASIFLSGPASQKGRQQKKIPPMVQLVRAIKCLDVFGRNDPERAAYYASKKYEDGDMAREFKALSATNPASGGFLIPEVYLDEIIGLLYNKTVIKELGARTIPLETGNINIPRMTSGTRATWGGEARKIKTTQPTFGNLRLSAKRLEAIVPQTRELIMSTKYSADEIFASDLSRRMQLGLDWGGLYGKGGEFQPTGIANTPGVEVIDATKMDAQYADSTGKITSDFPVYIKSLVLSKNVDDMNLGWAFNSFTEGYLMNLKTTTGDYIYRDEMNAGRFLGIPYATTNQIPTDPKAGTTDIFFGNWADLMIGDQMGLETYTTLDGSWTDEDGVQHNAFEENLTGTRALMYDDIGVRHVESFAYIKNVKVI